MPRENAAAVISGSVPMSQQHSGRRVVAVDVEVPADGWTDSAREVGQNLPNLLRPDRQDEEPRRFDARAYARIFREVLVAQGVRDIDLVGIDETIQLLHSAEPQTVREFDRVEQLLTQPKLLQVARRTPVRALSPLLEPAPAGLALTPGGIEAFASRLRRMGGEGVSEGGDAASQPDGATAPPIVLPLVPELRDALAALASGRYVLPIKKWPGNIGLIPYTPPPQATPTFFLIETYAITSSAGDYGLGRTVRTFSLFPGETTEIVVKTWRSDKATRSEASSIVDSFGTTSADRFNTELEKQAGTSSSVETSQGYSSEWHAGGGFNFIVSFESGGGEARNMQHHTNRQQFANQTSKAVREHASSSNANRQTTVSDSSELSTEQGEEQTTTRTIRNVNMRHTLNFVFRELNQEYVTRVHLVDLRIGFQNGQIGSWREAPLSGLRPFVQQFVADPHVDTVCSQIIKRAAVIFDHADSPVPVLDKLTWNAGALNITRTDAAPGPDGSFEAPAETSVYRFKPGQLGGQNHVDGVVLAESKIVMQTDSLVIEALMGQAEALDEYAMERQRADSEAAALVNERTRIANDAATVNVARAQAIVEAINAIPDARQRTKAYAEMFRPIVVDGDEVPIDQ